MNEELKPCTFCGGEVTIAKTGDGENGRLWWFITRSPKPKKGCKCRLFMESYDFHFSDPMEEKQAKRMALIEAWNRRADNA